MSLPNFTGHEIATSILNILLWPYRLSHALVGESIFATWAIGSMLAILAVMTLSFVLHFLLEQADNIQDAAFQALTREAKYEDAKELATRFVSTQSRISALMSLTGVSRAHSKSGSQFASPNISSISWWSVRILRFGSGIKTLLLSWIGATSILATLYVVRPEFIERILGRDWRNVLPDSIDLAVVSLSLAFAAFTLARFATAKARGQHDWRRQKAVEARDELVQLEFSVREYLPTLQSSLKRSWDSPPSRTPATGRGEAASRHLSEAEVKSAQVAASSMMAAMKTYRSQWKGKPNSIIPRSVRRPVLAAATSCDYALFERYEQLADDRLTLIDAQLELARLTRAQAAISRYLYRPSLLRRLSESLRP